MAHTGPGANGPIRKAEAIGLKGKFTGLVKQFPLKELGGFGVNGHGSLDKQVTVQRRAKLSAVLF
jgi:hypothetical protein